jgi:hypothetical protein
MGVPAAIAEGAAGLLRIAGQNDYSGLPVKDIARQRRRVTLSASEWAYPTLVSGERSAAKPNRRSADGASDDRRAHLIRNDDRRAHVIRKRSEQGHT